MPSLPPQAHGEPPGRTSLTASGSANCNKSADSHPTARRIEHGRRDGPVAAPDGPETRVVNSSPKQAPGAEPRRLGETPAVWLDTDLWPTGMSASTRPPSHPSRPLSIPPKSPNRTPHGVHHAPSVSTRAKLQVQRYCGDGAKSLASLLFSSALACLLFLLHSPRLPRGGEAPWLATHRR